MNQINNLSTDAGAMLTAATIQWPCNPLCVPVELSLSQVCYK